MFQIDKLTGETASIFIRLTFPSFRDNFVRKIEEGGYVAVGACYEGRPVGLALAELDRANRSASLESIVALSLFQKQGLASQLLDCIEQVCTEQGFEEIETIYGSTLKTRPALERLLAKAGWRSARDHRVIYVTNKNIGVENLKTWANQQIPLPEGCSFFLWKDLTPQQETNFKQNLRSNPDYFESAFPEDKPFDPRYSVGLLYQGQVAGFQLVFILSDNTVQYGDFWVRPDLRPNGAALALLMEAARLQIALKLPYRRLVWSTKVNDSHLQGLIENFLEPFSPQRVLLLKAKKALFLSQKPAGNPETATLVEILRQRALNQPTQRAFTFLVDGETREETLTYEELDRAALVLAARLSRAAEKGDRILLCLPPGLDYIKAFWGVLYAGMTAVPAYPPDQNRLNKSLPRLQAIMEDAGASLALTTAQLRPILQQVKPEIEWMASDEEEPLQENKPLPVKGLPTDLAFLMYTSGSTAQPRGVMVNHASAIYNMANFAGYKSRPLNGIVSWLPFFHDLGLFLGILHPIYYGVPAVLMSPMAFLQKPFRWLQAISQYRASATGAPNFAYELTFKKTTPEQRAALDLGCLNLALNGAEPVRAETLQQFSAIFGPSNFSHGAWYPSYGLAEGPCTITGGYFFEEPFTLEVDKPALQEKRVVLASPGEAPARKLVGNGGPLPGQRLVVVDPETRQAVPEGTTGEIWVGGPGLGLGYWQRPEDSRQTFQARLAHNGDGPFLRTGDLGFFQESELFITGRLKDLIIIRGRNYYPEDIEKTVEESHPAIRSGYVGVYSVQAGEAAEERVAVSCEVNSQDNLEEIGAAIRQAVSENQELNLFAITLLRPGSLPKTSSGKLQRHIYRDVFLAGHSESLWQWREDSPSRSGPDFTPVPYNFAMAIEDYLAACVARHLGLKVKQIDLRQPLDKFEPGPTWQIELGRALEKALDRSLAPGFFEDYPTIESAARYLAGLPVNPARHSVSTAEEPSQLHETVEPIAIVGMACRFPGANNPDEFWQLLMEGREAIEEVPSERWDLELLYDPDARQPGKIVTRRGGFLKAIDQFDPFFFGISPHEAHETDPRQRLLLETAWEALEDAGILPESLGGSFTGVYIANLNGDYGGLLFNDLGRIDAYSGPGSANSVLANRLSYFLNLHGPSLALDTACSGSLVALHLACQSLREDESGVALVGGVNIILKPDASLFFTKVGALSPEGRCKVFDAQANGMVRSEGASVLVLKTLRQAQADGDTIYAVVRGSAVNSDGHSQGLMAPDTQAQKAVIRRAFRQAGLSPAQAQYIEAHGTGTAVGDPLEVAALNEVLSEGRLPGRLCAVGSVKTNIGHTEAAAGMAGLIKVALALKNRLLPPSLHFRTPNPSIELSKMPLVVQRSAGRWPAENERLVAGVSSFGFGGTNAHVVLEEAPLLESAPRPENTSYKQPYLLTLSARTQQALQQLAQGYREKLAAAPAVNLPDLAYTLSRRRTHHARRLAVTGVSGDELGARLQSFLDGRQIPGVSWDEANDPAPPLVMVFSGQGTHWRGMGCELLASQPVFRASLEKCDEIIKGLAGWSLLEELQAPSGQSRLNSTEVTQPAIFGIQVALAALWEAWGIRPTAVVGQSLGEVTAAYVAGALSLEDAASIVVNRSRLMQQTAGLGKTAIVELTPELALQAMKGLENKLSLAGSNSFSTSVVSGDTQALTNLLYKLEKQEIFCRILPEVDVAFHSYQMEPLMQPLLESLTHLQPRPEKIPFYSSLKGEQICGESLTGAYWVSNLRDPFFFGKTIQQLIGNGFNHFLEVSPHPGLGGAAGQELARSGQKGVVLPSLNRGKPELAALYTPLGKLYTLGYPVNWQAVYPAGKSLTGMPAYPWQRESYWFDRLPGNGYIFNILNGKTLQVDYQGSLQIIPQSTAGAHPLLGPRLELSIPGPAEYYQARLSVANPSYLAQHQVQNLPIVPGAAFLEMALVAGQAAFPGLAFTLKDVRFQEALLLDAAQPRMVQLALVATDLEKAEFTISSEVKGPPGKKSVWVQHASGQIICSPSPVVENGSYPPQAIRDIQLNCPEEISSQQHYDLMKRRGLNYGPAFQGVKRIWRGNGEALGQITLPESLGKDLAEYSAHPVLLDASFQTIASAFGGETSQQTQHKKFVPVGLREFRQYEALPARLWCRVKTSEVFNGEQELLEADLDLLDNTGKAVAIIRGMTLQHIEVIAAPPPAEFAPEPEVLSENPVDWLYQLQWEVAAPTQTALAALAGPPGQWLIFSQDTFGPALRVQLEGRGEKAWLVKHSEDYLIEPGAMLVSLNPANPGHFRQLLVDIFREDAYRSLKLRGVVFAWTNAQIDGPVATADWENVLARGCYALTYLCQALKEKEPPGFARLCVVGHGSQAVESHPDIASLSQAPLWGLVGTIANEIPAFHALRVDLSIQSDPVEITALGNELFLANAGDQVVLRGGTRYSRRLAHLNPRKNKEAGNYRCLAEANYLIVGGLGGLGLMVARWLARQGARHLVLMGRSEPSPEVAENLEELRGQGLEINTVQADVVDFEQVKDVIAAMAGSGRPLRGIIHSALVLDDALLDNLNPESFLKVIRPKLMGSWNLHTLSQEEPLDFFIMFSSVASVIGSMGQGNYVAANAFLDELALYRQDMGLPTTTINWPAWQEIGYAARHGVIGRLENVGFYSITPAEGLGLLDLALREEFPQMAVMKARWSRVSQGNVVSKWLTTGLRNDTAPEGTSLFEISTQTLSEIEPARQQQFIENYLCHMLSGLLNYPVERLDVKFTLYNLGLDSLIAVTIKNQLETNLGISIPLANLMKGPTIKELASQIVELIPQGELKV